MKKIKVSELCRVNGYIGTWDEKTKIAVTGGIGSFQGYIAQALDNGLSTVEYAGSSDIKIVEFNKAERRDFQYEVDKAWDLTDGELINGLRKRVYQGN